MESAFEAPTAELLLDTKTPAELALSPDGSTLAFSLHATVADVGSYVPCDLYVGGHRIRRRADAAHRRGVRRRAAGLVARRFPAGVPVRSDHVGPSVAVHDAGRWWGTHAGRHAHRFGRERRVVQRREPSAGARRRPRFLRAGLGGSRGPWRRARVRSDRAPAGRCAAPTVPDRSRVRGRHGGGSARPQHLGGGLGRRSTPRWRSSPPTTPDRAGTRAWWRDSICRRAPHTRSTSPSGRWKGWNARPTAPGR